MAVIDYIPFPETELNWDDPIETEYIAWELADGLVDVCNRDELLPEIVQFYAIYLYTAQVENGGHSQLIYNLPVMKREWVLEEACKGAAAIVSTEFLEIVEDCQRWALEHPEDALEQTGFTDGRAEFLDYLDDRHAELNDDSTARLKERLGQNPDAHELAFVQAVLNDATSNNSHLLALRTLWLMRSGLIRPIPDEDVLPFFETRRQARS